MSVQVSVVVPTFNSPPELDGLVASIDAQSLPWDAFEAVFVDDGSTDATYARLQEFARTRPYVRIHRIESSGWSGRPRNVGIRAATGEFVFFADHDDYLFPEALERMYAFATAHELDVVHPKEVVEGWKVPSWRTWQAQVPRISQLSSAVVQCNMPHKLYRRSFLVDHDVWFPEGRVRLEDFEPNAKAWARTDAIGVLADYPCYRWRIHETNTHKLALDLDVYWASFRRSVQPILEEVPPSAKRDVLLLRWYHSPLLKRVRQLSRLDPEDVTWLLAVFTDLLPDFPPELEAQMAPADRARSALLRTGDRDALLALSVLDLGIGLAVHDLRTGWNEGRWEVTVRLHLVTADGSPFPVDVVDGRVMRRVPDGPRSAVDAGVWDLTEAVETGLAELVVRSRADKVDWILPSRSSSRVVTLDGVTTLEIEVSSAVDPQRSALGGPLVDDVWDVYVRELSLGYTATHRLRGGPEHASTALVDGRAAMVYVASEAFLSVDLVGRARSFSELAVPGRRALRHLPGAGSRITLPRTHVWGETSIPGTVMVGRQVLAARLIGRNGRARIVTDERLTGPGRVRARFSEALCGPLFALPADVDVPVVARRATAEVTPVAAAGTGSSRGYRPR
ncbi:MAG: glycosyltransferase family 2 protein [Nocardioidaceae bacterium]